MSKKDNPQESLSHFLDEVSKGRVAFTRENKELLERLVKAATPAERAKEKKCVRHLRPFFSVEEVASMQDGQELELLRPILDRISEEEVDDTKALGGSLPEGVDLDAHKDVPSWQNHVNFWEQAGQAAYEAEQQDMIRVERKPEAQCGMNCVSTADDREFLDEKLGRP